MIRLDDMKNSLQNSLLLSSNLAAPNLRAMASKFQAKKQ